MSLSVIPPDILFPSEILFYSALIPPAYSSSFFPSPPKPPTCSSDFHHFASSSAQYFPHARIHMLMLIRHPHPHHLTSHALRFFTCKSLHLSQLCSLGIHARPHPPTPIISSSTSSTNSLTLPPQRPHPSQHLGRASGPHHTRHVDGPSVAAQDRHFRPCAAPVRCHYNRSCFRCVYRRLGGRRPAHGVTYMPYSYSMSMHPVQ